MVHDRTDSTGDDPRGMGASQAPTPFTAAEIRRGCPPGRTIRLLVEAAGERPFERVSRFVRCDEHGATIERFQVGPDGQPMQPSESQRATWADLQRHASFPADQTSIEPETLETAIGTLECRRYTVIDGSTVRTFWFAVDLPGMPIRYAVEADGRVVMTVSIVSNTTS